MRAPIASLCVLVPLAGPNPTRGRIRGSGVWCGPPVLCPSLRVGWRDAPNHLSAAQMGV
jgi:hypothetical protein